MQVVGARPQFVKLAPVCRAIEAAQRRRRGDHEPGRAYRPALRPGDVGRLLLRAWHSAGRTSTSASAPAPRPADRPHAGSARDGDARAPAGHGADLRRHQLDARRDAGGRQAARAGRPHRGRPAQLQPADARGSEPPRRRPSFRPAVRADAGSDAQPGERGPRRPRPPRRRRHAGRDPRLRAGRARTLARARTPRAREGRLPRRDTASRGQHRGLAPRRAARSARGGRHTGAARDPPAAPAHGPRHPRCGPRAARRAADCGPWNRSATST